MKNKNKLLVGVLALLLVLSVGYALFSEQITIDGTATAKGDFEITTTEVDKDYAEEYFMVMYRPEYENPTISIKDNVVTTSVSLKNPGAYYTFGVKMENTGSIPARVKSIRDLTNNSIIYDRDTNTYGDYFYNVGEGQNLMGAELWVGAGYYSDYADSPEDYTRIAEAGVSEGFGDAILDPGESAYFFFTYNWNENATSSESSLSLSWNVQINFEQVTAN